MSKFGNKKILYKGMRFDSIYEFSIYNLLLQKGYTVLDRQPKIYLSAAKILYKPDFKCKGPSDERIFFVEAKGFETPIWRLKKRLWASYGVFDLHVYSKKGIEVIKPPRASNLIDGP